MSQETTSPETLRLSRQDEPAAGGQATESGQPQTEQNGTAEQNSAVEQPLPVERLRITPQEFLAHRRGDGVVYLFDLRDAESFAAGHLPGAYNLPFEYLADSLYRMPFNGKILFYDGGEGVAAQGASMLAENGFTDLFYLEEGAAALLQAMADSPDEVHYERMSREERVEAIEKVLDEKVRGFLASDGGGLTVVGIEEERVMVAYEGACSGCASSTGGTLRFIENALTVGMNHPIQVVPIDQAG